MTDFKVSSENFLWKLVEAIVRCVGLGRLMCFLTRKKSNLTKSKDRV